MKMSTALLRTGFLAPIAFMSVLIVISGNVSPVHAWSIVESTSWQYAHATFYGGLNAAGTMGGACGFGNLYTTGYGVSTTALSGTLFNGGTSCGACFELKCVLSQSKWCYATGGSIIITATNLCPANWARTTDGWCNPPRNHFDLAYPMFAKLAQRVAGIIPVQWRRVPCIKQGGIRFQINGNPWFMLVLVFNVGGAGDVYSMESKGTSTISYYKMTHNWGGNWQLKEKLTGQALSFRVTLSDNSQLTSTRAVNKYWRFGSTYECTQNFGPVL
ncbi:unnamed protein product [Calypogeia fissa]